MKNIDKYTETRTAARDCVDNTSFADGLFSEQEKEGETK